MFISRLYRCYTVLTNKLVILTIRFANIIIDERIHPFSEIQTTLVKIIIIITQTCISIFHLSLYKVGELQDIYHIAAYSGYSRTVTAQLDNLKNSNKVDNVAVI